MGKRLSKIYTKTGDGGETGLGDGSRISKSHALIEAIGSVDELNSLVGVLLADIATADSDSTLLNEVESFLNWSQHKLFDLGGEMSIPGYQLIKDEDVARIEQALDALNENLRPLENFILPGGSRLIANTHLCRSVCRRAERDMIRANETKSINTAGLKFINRLSDYLFVAARIQAKATNTPEVLWQQQ